MRQSGSSDHENESEFQEGCVRSTQHAQQPQNTHEKPKYRERSGNQYLRPLTVPLLVERGVTPCDTGVGVLERRAEALVL